VIPDYADETAGYAIMAEPLHTDAAWDEIASADGEVARHSRFRHTNVAYRVRAIIGMAGAEAELEFSAGRGLGDGDDRNWITIALEHIDGIPDGMSASYERRLRTRTRALVRRHRAAIERMAQALHDRSYLDAAEIDRLVWPETDDPRARRMKALRSFCRLAE
jgi:hypothetical protein